VAKRNLRASVDVTKKRQTRNF